MLILQLEVMYSITKEKVTDKLAAAAGLFINSRMSLSNFNVVGEGNRDGDGEQWFGTMQLMEDVFKK